MPINNKEEVRIFHDPILLDRHMDNEYKKDAILNLPSGSMYLVKIPVKSSELSLLRPVDLFAVKNYSSKAIKQITGVESFHSRSLKLLDEAIERRILELTDEMFDIWLNGYGFPRFDDEHRLIEFFVDKEGLKEHRERLSRNERDSDENKAAGKEGADGLAALQENQGKPEEELPNRYGGTFKNPSEMFEYIGGLTREERSGLHSGYQKIEDVAPGQWKLVAVPQPEKEKPGKDAREETLQKRCQKLEKAAELAAKAKCSAEEALRSGRRSPTDLPLDTSFSAEVSRTRSKALKIQGAKVHKTFDKLAYGIIDISEDGGYEDKDLVDHVLGELRELQETLRYTELNSSDPRDTDSQQGFSDDDSDSDDSSIRQRYYPRPPSPWPSDDSFLFSRFLGSHEDPPYLSGPDPRRRRSLWSFLRGPSDVEFSRRPPR